MTTLRFLPPAKPVYAATAVAMFLMAGPGEAMARGTISWAI